MAPTLQTLLVAALIATAPLAPPEAPPARAFIVRLRPGPHDSAANAPRHLTVASGGDRRALLEGLPARDADAAEFEGVTRVEAPDANAATRLAHELAASPGVEWFEPDAPRWPATVDFPNDPLFLDSRQWGLDNRGAAGVYAGVAGADIHARDAWGFSRGAPWLRLAIADTGIDPTHPDLAGSDTEGPRVIGFNVTGEPGASWADSLGHGTTVAGVMAARTNDGPHLDSLGVAGVCGGDGGPNAGCRLIVMKISPGRSPYASSFDIARAIVSATDLGARAINVSFVGSQPSRIEREALLYAIERGCLVVAAAGNNAARDPRAPQYPAAYAADGLCLQVGATDAWDRRAPWSSFGPGLDLVAPGLDIWTTWLTYPNALGYEAPGYSVTSGTSLAAPFATGAAGLVVALRPELTADDVRHVLRDAARDVGARGPDAETGRGVVDPAAALRGLGPDVGVWHDEVAADTWLDTGTDTLVTAESGPGNMPGPHVWPRAHRIEARATVVLPDSFADSIRVWPRITGTSTVRGDFRLPYFAPCAEVLMTGARSFTLRGWCYRVDADWGDTVTVPLPEDQMRFGFTVIGRVVRPSLGFALAATDRSLAIRPNPFRGTLVIEHRRGATVEVFDAAGRRVRRWPPGDSVADIDWDGRDTAGAPAAPGLYWIRSRDPRGARLVRAIKLE